MTAQQAQPAMRQQTSVKPTSARALLRRFERYLVVEANAYDAMPQTWTVRSTDKHGNQEDRSVVALSADAAKSDVYERDLEETSNIWSEVIGVEMASAHALLKQVNGHSNSVWEERDHLLYMHQLCMEHELHEAARNELAQRRGEDIDPFGISGGHFPTPTEPTIVTVLAKGPGGIALELPSPPDDRQFGIVPPNSPFYAKIKDADVGARIRFAADRSNSLTFLPPKAAPPSAPTRTLKVS